ncbi:uncharacterized protein LAJ45_03388 [Morchella importuna]|uniref:uncharacterized protein n=1 Tax=Morchella importuna TaxID=1174673 RepID=UPI001E8E8516|nr:uncharacterized protein LAJ45_03388 [Morchella importuna]KAH8152548.1 hypothetical protein LAJ45_03388 [Morchella importuna]
MGIGRFFCFGSSGKKSQRHNEKTTARSLDAPGQLMSDKQPHAQSPTSHITTIPDGPPPAYAGIIPPAAPYNQFTPMPENHPYPYPPQPHTNPYHPHIATSPTIEPVTRRFSFRANATVGVDHYSALRNFDTTSSALEAIVPICTAHDADGVDIYFLNHPRAHTQVRSPAEVLSIFSSVRPCGATPTGRRLGEILELYLAAYRRNAGIKPLNIIVITDGEPTDPGKLKRCIVDCAKSLDALGARDRQVGVQFFQVGNDEAATESLEELDNELVEEEGVRDMVDTISWRKMNEGKGLSADGILKAVMGAVDKRLDRTQRA